MKNTYDPWLATSGTWSGNTYTIVVRNGVKWSDGTALTGADVAYSINLAMTNKSDPYNSNVSTVKSATASGNTVTVTFNSPPGYSEWQDYLWKAPVVPQHIWSKLSATQQITGANTKPVGTGPMLLATYNATEVAYQDNPNWWAISQLGLKFKFKYLVDVVNGSNNVELSALTAGQVDWSNNFLPGINELISGLGGNAGYGLKTFYASSPYMLPANTVWLEPNTTKAPMNNVNFRKAMAYAINPQQLVSVVYSGITEPAGATGLLPNLKPYIDQGMVSQYGFSYNPALAKQYLAKSGYHGQNLTLEVPDGWTDWMAGVQVISQDLAAVGIKVTPDLPPVRGPDHRPDERQLRPGAGQQRPARLHAVELLPAGVRAADRSAADGPAQLGALQLAVRLGPGAAGGQHAGDRHGQAELDLQPAGEGFPRPAPADPGLVQRRLVPGQHQVLDQLRRERHQQREHPGHVGRLPRGHDDRVRPGRAGAGPGAHAVTRTAIPIRYRQLNGSMRPVIPPGRIGG